MKSFLRAIVPVFVNDYRHRRYVLRALGLPRHMTDGMRCSAVTAKHVEQCRYDLWPEELRRAPFNWSLVDVGANQGSFTSSVLAFASPVEVIAFEPQPSCHDVLRMALATHGGARIISAAVGSTSGTIRLNCTGDSQFSSILEPLPGMAPHYESGAMGVRHRVTVPLVTLDEVLSRVGDVGILKVDVQGFELEVLRGARDVLRRTTAVLIELNYMPHYEGAVTFDEVYRFLTSQGFFLRGISKPYSDQGVPLWSDGMFVRDSGRESIWRSSR